ncbi:MAG: lysophospholipid acyltransferase family protein [Nitrospirae bacterium]|nr:lysophospholipid acyltransferase family protein [Nitrospirota bacterium]MBI3351895.1 lysophospholipid acyltransferase family protein [Nitrospirota bacterium]
MKNKLLLKILPFFGFLILVLLRLTMKIKTVGKEVVEDYFKNDKRFILAFWHGRQLFMPYSYHGKKIHILISQHGDGEIVSRAMRYYGFGSIRGSSTRGGFKAFREMIKISRESDLAITPDGPKGPPCKAQAGVVELARLTGLPIIPVTFGASKKKPLNHGINLSSPVFFQRES